MTVKGLPVGAKGRWYEILNPPSLSSGQAQYCAVYTIGMPQIRPRPAVRPSRPSMTPVEVRGRSPGQP
jgi:hypothetical protein